MCQKGRFSKIRSHITIVDMPQLSLYTQYKHLIAGNFTKAALGGVWFMRLCTCRHFQMHFTFVYRLILITNIVLYTSLTQVPNPDIDH